MASKLPVWAFSHVETVRSRLDVTKAMGQPITTIEIGRVTNKCVGYEARIPVMRLFVRFNKDKPIFCRKWIEGNKLGNKTYKWRIHIEWGSEKEIILASRPVNGPFEVNNDFGERGNWLGEITTVGFTLDSVKLQKAWDDNKLSTPPLPPRVRDGHGTKTSPLMIEDDPNNDDDDINVQPTPRRARTAAAGPIPGPASLPPREELQNTNRPARSQGRPALTTPETRCVDTPSTGSTHDRRTGNARTPRAGPIAPTSRVLRSGAAPCNALPIATPANNDNNRDHRDINDRLGSYDSDKEEEGDEILLSSQADDVN